MAHEHEHEEESVRLWQLILPAVMLAGGLACQYMDVPLAHNAWVRAAWYVVAFLPVGAGVIKEAVEHAAGGDFFSEFMLMSIAAVGAMAIGEFPEAVAVMLLYQVGEILQDRAVDRARDSIESMMALRPDKAYVVRNGGIEEVAPEAVSVGATIEVRPGDRVPLDGRLLTADAAFNTAALTGESVPRLIGQGRVVMAGMIATDAVVRLSVVRPAGESAVARILTMVEEAQERKAPTELFIHRFAHVYTPIVFLLALCVVLVPWLWSLLDGGFSYTFSTWLERALVFLVISCPCALVISVPLGYFAGIGAASRSGILFKGGNWLDAITEVDTVVFDKTGTLTTGEFRVQRVEGLSAADLATVAAIEQTISHPIAQAIVRHQASLGGAQPAVVSKDDVRNIAGYGLSCGGWLVGTARLLEKNGVACPESLRGEDNTLVAVARDGQYRGCILLADTLKADAHEAIDSLPTAVHLLSGDKQSLVSTLGNQLGISADHCHGDLLPQDKVAHIEQLQRQGHKVAFVGDGINDAPVLALSHVGIAMGAMGADMAVETADVILQDDSPSKVALAVRIGKRTRAIVHQNIAFSIGVKVLVMLLGLVGVVNMWIAVFADTGVALLAVLNAMRGARR